MQISSERLYSQPWSEQSPLGANPRRESALQGLQEEETDSKLLGFQWTMDKDIFDTFRTT